MDPLLPKLLQIIGIGTTHEPSHAQGVEFLIKELIPSFPASMMASHTLHLAPSVSSTMLGSRDRDSCKMPITLCQYAKSCGPSPGPKWLRPILLPRFLESRFHFIPCSPGPESKTFCKTKSNIFFHETSQLKTSFSSIKHLGIHQIFKAWTF